MHSRWTAALLLGALVLVLHVHTLDAYFLSDDFDILQIAARKHSLGEALLMTYAGNWGPVSYVQFYLNHEIGGLNPLVYHLTNLSWLWLGVYALWAFVRAAWPEAPFAAWAAALLFTVHPVHDEAVSYICSRSHLCAATLGLVTLALHERSRRAPLLRIGAIITTYLAALSKESALTIPAWICALEWLRQGDQPGLPRRAGRALLLALPYVIAAGAAPLTRALVVGGTPPKLEDAGEMASVTGQAMFDLPFYALYGALPIPFAWMDRPTLEPWRALGWIVLVLAIALGIWLFLRDELGRSNRAASFYVLGLTIAILTVAPGTYADLPLRRRYLFITTIGVVLMAAAGLERLRASRPKLAQASLAVAVVVLGAGLAARNDLYRRAGDVSRNLFDTIRGQPDAAHLRKPVVLTLPRYYGGDDLSGTYLLHHTDVDNGLNLFGMYNARIAYPLQCQYADDWSAQTRWIDAQTLDLVVGFRTRRAYEAARALDPEEDRRMKTTSATLAAEDPDRRELTWRITLKDEFWEKERALFVYGDGRFERLFRP